MKYLLFIFAAIMASYVSAQVSLPPGYKEKYPNYYKFSKKARQTRDVTWDRDVGKGRLGSLGNNDQGLFDKGDKQEIFNGEKLGEQVYGTNVLGQKGYGGLAAEEKQARRGGAGSVPERLLKYTVLN